MPKNNLMDSTDIIKEFLLDLDSIYRVYLDSCEGFEAAKARFEQSRLVALENNIQKDKNRKEGDNTRYNLTLESFDRSCLIYRRGIQGTSGYQGCSMLLN